MHLGILNFYKQVCNKMDVLNALMGLRSESVRQSSVKVTTLYVKVLSGTHHQYISTYR